VLKIENLRFSYARREAEILRGLELELPAGKVGILLGKNGCGKTTLFKSVLGIEKPGEGKISFAGKELNSFSPRERAKLVAYVPQHIHFGNLSVYDSILMGRVAYFGSKAGESDRAVVDAIISEMGLESFAERNAEALSGGEKQKIAIARALAQEPALLIFDEPTGNLDMANEQLIIREARRLAEKRAITILSSLHDLNQALQMGDCFYLMRDGVIRYAGGSEILTPEHIREIFDIDIRIIEIDGEKIIIGGKQHETL